MYIDIEIPASSVTFDSTVTGGNGLFLSTLVQDVLTELRDKESHVANTTATTLNGTLDLEFTTAQTDVTTQVITGTATGFSISLPDATSLPGVVYTLINASTQPVSIRDDAGTLLFVLSQTSIGWAILRTDGVRSAAGVWVTYQAGIGTATGIISYSVTSSTAFSTTSASDVPITGFSVTPQAGTYKIDYNSENTCTGSGVDNKCTIYQGVTPMADSGRHATSPAGTHTFTMSTITKFQFDGSTACSISVQTGGSLTVNERTLILTRLGA
jgi:hypothetical protein